MAEDISTLQEALETIPSTDQSVEILNSVFGPGWTDLLPGGTGDGGAAVSVLFPMLEKFNVVVLTFVAIVGLWSVIRGAIGTAHEGEIMGKAVHTVWAPVRFAISTAMISPLPLFKGLCLFQVFVMGAIGLSVAFANWCWNGALDYLEDTGGQLVLSVPESATDNAVELAEGLLQTASVACWLSKENGISSTGISTEVDDGGATLFLPVPIAATVSKGDMGTVRVPCNYERGASTCTQKINNIRRLYNSMVPIADALVHNEGVSTSAFWTAIADYKIVATQVNAEIISESNVNLQEDIADFVETAKAAGWYSAGQYFWTLSNIQERVTWDAYGTPTYTGMRGEKIQPIANVPIPGPTLTAYLNKIDDYIKDSTLEHMTDAAMAGTGPNYDGLNGALYSLINSMNFSKKTIALSVEALSESHEPLNVLSNLGHMIINGASLAVLGYVSFVATASSTEKATDNPWVKWIPVGGAIGQAAAAFFKTSLEMIGPYVTMMIVAILVLGFTFAYYLPYLPFILWIAACIAWLVVSIEGIVAAPVWIAVHSFPEGEGMVHDRAKQGYLLLINIALRPALMVMGLIFSMVIISQVSSFIGKAFLVFYSGESADYGMQIPVLSYFFNTFAMLTVFVSTMVVLCHKVFGLITHLPEHVIRWVGGQGSQLGESQDEGRTRAIFGAVAGEHKGGARGMAAVGRGGKGGGGKKGIGKVDAGGDSGGGESEKPRI